MRIKRNISVCLLFVLTAGLLAVPALAHGCGRSGGHHGGRTAVQPAAIAVCTVEDCAIAGRHTHGGAVYCGYDHAGGCCDGSCRALCTVEDCAIAGRHTHNGTVYCGYGHAGGFCDGNCLALCAVKGCTITGQHTHGAAAYCGQRHGCGFCDGSCRTV